MDEIENRFGGDSGASRGQTVASTEGDSGEVLQPHGLIFVCFMSFVCIRFISAVRFQLTKSDSL